MAIRMDTQMPSDEELKIPEIKLSTWWLKAVAPYMYMHCEKEAMEFMMRRREMEDPRKSLKEGRLLTECGIKFLEKLNRNCFKEAEQFASCIEHSHHKLYSYPYCEGERKSMDECVLSALDVKRPPHGYFSKLIIYEGNAPKPKAVYRDYKAEAREVIDDMPEDYHLKKDYRRFNDWAFAERIKQQEAEKKSE